MVIPVWSTFAIGVGAFLLSWLLPHFVENPPVWFVKVGVFLGCAFIMFGFALWMLPDWVSKPRTWPVILLFSGIVACGVGLIFVLDQQHSTVTPVEDTTKKPDDDNLPTTLKELFESDFPESVKHHYSVTVRLGEPIESIDVPVNVISNYAAETKFISFYVPFHGGATPEICMSVSKHFDEFFTRSKQHKFTLGRPGDSGDDSDFPLSDVVYIYHEAPMDLQEMASVDTHYQEHGMRVHLRGQDYVSTRWP